MAIMVNAIKVTNLGDVLDFLEEIKKREQVSVAGAWDLDQNLVHCAHSIEFAMSGYPFEKSRIFQRTIGSLVFHYFDWKGSMQHGTNELIPGEKTIVDPPDVSGVAALEMAIKKFDNWTKPLNRHRFYGRLSKSQYARAHVLHIANHLELVEFL